MPKRNELVIVAPSYRRADKAVTQNYLAECLYVVSRKEAEEYRKTGKRVIECPDAAQGNLSRVRNWILDNLGKNLVIVDDDLTGIGRWNGGESKILTPDAATEALEQCAMIAKEAGVRFWGLNCTYDKGAYREYTPLSFKSYIGGPVQGHINNPCRYSETIFLKEDYDMTLAVLNLFRKALRFNFLFYQCDQCGMTGGCAAYRSIAKEKEHNRLLKAKWGNCVSFDGGEAKETVRKRQKTYDINPIIKAPIGGI